MKIIPLRIKDKEAAKSIMASIGVTAAGIKILAPKSTSLSFKIEGIKSWEANIIKQHLLSLGTVSEKAAIEAGKVAEDIKARARRDAEAEAARIIAQANERAKEILAQGKRRRRRHINMRSRVFSSRRLKRQV